MDFELGFGLRKEVCYLARCDLFIIYYHVISFSWSSSFTHAQLATVSLWRKLDFMKEFAGLWRKYF